MSQRHCDCIRQITGAQVTIQRPLRAAFGKPGLSISLEQFFAAFAIDVGECVKLNVAVPLARSLLEQPAKNRANSSWSFFMAYNSASESS